MAPTLIVALSLLSELSWTLGIAIRQQRVGVRITGSICAPKGGIVYGQKLAFQKKELKPEWFEDPNSPSTEGKHAKVLVLPINKKCKKKAKKTDNCITLDDIQGENGIEPLLKIARKHNKNKQAYAIAKFNKGSKEYQFGTSKGKNKEVYRAEKRALCIFYHFNTARDFSGEKTPSYHMWAGKEWRGSPGTLPKNPSIFFPKGPESESCWSKDGRSGYWDPSVIYHETGHAVWNAMKQGRAFEGMDFLEKALVEGFCDAFSCAILMETGQIARGSDCVLGPYYDRSSGGVRSDSYKATGTIPKGHKFDYIVKNKCNTNHDDDEGACEKHRVGEVIASALFRAMASGVQWSIIMSGIKEIVRLTSVDVAIKSTTLKSSTETSLVQTTRDCIMAQIKDDKTYSVASAVFAEHGMGIDMDQSHDNNVGKAGYKSVTTAAAGAKHYKCQRGFRKPPQVSQSDWKAFKPIVGIKM
jgi:hypothetical protein